MARENAKSFQQALERLETTFKPRLEEAGEALHELKDRVVDSARPQAERLDQEVRKNPWAFIGAAAVLSLFVGFFLGRRSK